jgi:hypothetical protein
MYNKHNYGKRYNRILLKVGFGTDRKLQIG